jgi:hypothetical protein
MKKNLILLFYVLIMVSCQTKKGKPLVLSSNGKINTITVVMPNQLWQGTIGQTVRDTYAYPAEGLPQQEPLYDLKQIPPEIFTGFAQSSRSVLWIGISDQTNVRIDKNTYAQPQTTAVFTAPTADQLTEIIISQSNKVIETIRKQERIERLRRIKKSTYINHGLEEKFGISLTMPSAYNTLKEGENTIWFQREIQKGHVNLLVLTTPYDETIVSQKNLEQIIANRDSIGKAFIPGRLPNSYLITEKAYEPYVYHTSFGNKPALEIRGTWEVQGDFMAGPFLQYIINDKANNRNIILEGFVFAPSTAKRDYIFEVETILISIKEKK